jgi:hypothetical protein
MKCDRVDELKAVTGEEQKDRLKIFWSTVLGRYRL